MVRDVSLTSKAARFPEKLLKRLSERLERIAMGRDPYYNDQSLRQTVGVFYGTYKEASLQKQFRENRKVEELILIFVTSAQKTLRARIEGDGWKEELNKQVGQFVKIVRECLKTMHGVSRELTDRLDGYSAKLSPAPISLGQADPDAMKKRESTGADLNAVASSSNALATERRASAASSVTAVGGSNPIAESAMIRTVGELFQVEEEQLRKDVDFMKATATEKAAMIDLKHCVKNINLQASWPARREDFKSDEAYQKWRGQELQDLSSIMAQMCRANPELLRTTNSDINPRTGTGAGSGAGTEDGGSVPGAGDADATAAGDGQDPEDEETTFGAFTFIPPDPRAYYRRALELCIDYDLEQIKYQAEDEEVSLSILSRSHVELLAECSLRWRLMSSFRDLMNLDVIKYRSDHEQLVKVCTSLFESFMRFIHEAFQDMHNVDPEDVQPYLALISDLHESGLVRADGQLEGEILDMSRFVEDLKDRIRIMAIHEYTAKTTDLFSQIVDNEIVPLVQLLDWLLDWVEKGAKKIDRKYPEPVLGSVDPVSLLLEKQVSLYLDDLDSMKQQIVDHARRDRNALPFEDVYTLYGRVKGLLRMHAAFCPDLELSFVLSEWFEPHIHQWLTLTEKKTGEWVNNAISSDRFQPIESEGAVHSSSIDDLFGALQQPLDFISSMDWPDPYSNARFLTSLAKTVSRSIEQYCNRVEELFMEEMFPRTADDQDAQSKQSAWMVKAKQTLQGEKRVEPFHFQPTSCVKLNNIEAARSLLDKIYQRIDADEQARIITSQGPRVPDKQSQDRYIFTIKLVLGENLQPIKSSSATARIDSFVTLSDERGNKIAKTRTIYETPDPRWDEAFDIPVEKQMWLAATVWDRKLVGDHVLCGRAYLRLDPRYFADHLAHELWLDLDTQGKLLTRVSMEGEKDDILFHFGRAFRSLKRCESDMIRIIVDKMSIFIRQCLSRQVLKSLVRTSGINLDKALGNVKALYAQALASTNVNGPSIPPVQADLPKKQRPAQLTDQEIEGAILPLLDYLDECLATLKGNLSESESLLVLTKVWKEVLNTIDAILLPPLSDAPSDMPQLSGKEVEVVFKWLSMLRNYFNAYDEETGIAHGVPLEVLQGPKYREIVAYTLHHDANTDSLMEACVRELQQRLRRAPSRRAKNKSVLQQRSLGTIKKRKQDKKGEEQDDSLDVILRLLRMRPGTTDFLRQQFATISSLQAAMGSGGAAAASAGGGPRQRPPAIQRASRGPGGAPLPPLPSSGYR
ncbi:GRAM DOMAIN-CONTAINING PROTEIN 4 [Ceraceosorus bombacis]|uniref:GRAM DOMAIN-CONTAINING PROTEIN 4 n=1 Tax=Ceraceosorus bombacis TaxID=401625 RepID=A0A0P1BSK4_9BASI|nr:GRAM DOMAIN-CONTAINING PROTEIN 4 [Ceraceosorus bombacis]